MIDVSDPANCRRVGGDGNRREYEAFDVAVSGNYAYIAEKPNWTGSNYVGGGLQVIDVSNPTNCVRVRSYDTSGEAVGVAVSGSYAYVADGHAGLQVVDVRNPTNCTLVGSYDTRGGYARSVTVHATRIYVADGEAGLVVLPIFTNAEFVVRVDATPDVPFTLEAATDLSAPFPWTPLLTTNVPAMPFDYVDYDVRLSEKPHKFYRVRQP